MQTGIITRFKKEINYYGISYFIRLKATEIFYRFKTRNLQLLCMDGCKSIDKTNSHSINGDSMKNESTAFYEIKKGLDITGLRYSSISMLDIGCGYGKQLIFGMMNGFKKVAGIDLDELAVEKAKMNCAQMQTKSYSTHYEVQQSDACEFVLPEDINVIYMANPFGKKTMQTVMEKIIQYRYNCNGPLYIVYSVPVQQEVMAGYAECIKIYEKPGAYKRVSVLAVFEVIKCNHLSVAKNRQSTCQCI